MTYTRGQFGARLLKNWGAEKTRRNRIAIQAWMQAEGDAARFNPLNTTENWQGATVFNSDGVKNYQSFEDGVAATSRTLNYGADHNLHGYRAIRNSLRANRSAKHTLEAVEASAWGTGGLGLLTRIYVALRLRKYEKHPIVQ